MATKRPDSPGALCLSVSTMKKGSSCNTNNFFDNCQYRNQDIFQSLELNDFRTLGELLNLHLNSASALGYLKDWNLKIYSRPYMYWQEPTPEGLCISFILNSSLFSAPRIYNDWYVMTDIK